MVKLSFKFCWIWNCFRNLNRKLRGLFKRYLDKIYLCDLDSGIIPDSTLFHYGTVYKTGRYPTSHFVVSAKLHSVLTTSFLKLQQLHVWNEVVASYRDEIVQFSRGHGKFMYNVLSLCVLCARVWTLHINRSVYGVNVNV